MTLFQSWMAVCTHLPVSITALKLSNWIFLDLEKDQSAFSSPQPQALCRYQTILPRLIKRSIAYILTN